MAGMDTNDGSYAPAAMGGMDAPMMGNAPAAMGGMDAPMMEAMPPAMGMDAPMMEAMPQQQWVAWAQCIWNDATTSNGGGCANDELCRRGYGRYDC